MFRLQAKGHFDAAHHLVGYDGKCARDHGHRWDVEVCLEGEQLDSLNMLVDFKMVKQILKAVLDRLDHYDLNKELVEACPTAEFIAKWVYDKFCWWLKDLKLEVPIRVARVTIWESPDCCIKYSPRMNATGEELRERAAASKNN